MIYSIGRLTRYFGALLALGMLLFSSPAVAREYETHIEVETAEDVYSLLRAGIIDDQTAALLEIYLQDPIPINQANAEMLYDLPGLTWALAQAIVADRVQNGPFNTAGDLLRVSGMDPNLVKSISPFVTLIKPGLRGRKGKDGISGHTRFGTIWKDGVGKSQSVVDPILDKNIGPQGLLQLRADGFGQYGVGALVTYRRQTDAWWDYARGALVTTGPENQATLDHVYGWGSIGNAKVIVGSYDVGFGERLVFDTSSHRNPDGLYLNTRYTVDNDAGVIRPDTSLFGIAATIEDVPVGPGQVDATFFSSYQ
ncbi:helix-hairpin-helix domain-containing protein, partial [Myxococcota bacterium]|nr:helix-hairpin-helix domain-containing protein [Myxococcota bacterium]